jgi:hypothetical protein
MRINTVLKNIPINEIEEIDKLEEQLSEVERKILRVEYNITSEVELPLTDKEKGEWRLSQKAYREQVTKHGVNQQKAFATIMGQCTQWLQDKMHDDPQWEVVNKNQKPLELYALIKRVVMEQSRDEYAAHNLVENLMGVLTLKQQINQSNAQWYKKLNTRVDVAESVGVQFDNFASLWEYCCTAKDWGEYQTLAAGEQETICNKSKERLIINSSNTPTHEPLNNNLMEAFIAKRDEYPTARSKAIMLLNKYDERKPPPTAASEGTAFVQAKGKKKGEEKKKGDEKAAEEKPEKKDFFKDRECFICNKKGHPAAKCPSRKKSTDSDDSSISSKSSKIEELEKKMKKQFTQLKAQLEDDDKDLDANEQSTLQFIHFSLANHCLSPGERNLAISMKQSRGTLDDLYLREVILLNNQSMMSLFCNWQMVTNIQT